MLRRLAKKHQPCPCQSGKTNWECCFAAGFNWYADEQGRWVDSDGQPRRLDSSSRASHPRNYVEHRVRRWKEVEKHTIAGLRSLFGQTLSEVDYVGVSPESKYAKVTGSEHSFDWGHVQLRFGQLCIQLTQDYEPALWGDEILVCRQGVPGRPSGFVNHDDMPTTDASNSELWSQLIGEQITEVRLYGDAEIPFATSIIFDQQVVSIMTSMVFELAGADEYDPCTITRKPTDELLDSYVDLFWSNEDD